MTEDVLNKARLANEKFQDVGVKLKAYREALSEATKAYDDLANALAVIISQPYIEVDTRNLE